MADINSLLVETINGVRIVRAFSAEAQEVRRFGQENNSFYKLMMKAIKRAALVTPLTEFFGVIFGACILVFVGKDVIKGKRKDLVLQEGDVVYVPESFWEP